MKLAVLLVYWTLLGFLQLWFHWYQSSSSQSARSSTVAIPSRAKERVWVLLDNPILSESSKKETCLVAANTIIELKLIEFDVMWSSWERLWGIFWHPKGALKNPTHAPNIQLKIQIQLKYQQTNQLLTETCKYPYYWLQAVGLPWHIFLDEMASWSMILPWQAVNAMVSLAYLCSTRLPTQRVASAFHLPGV